MLPTRGTRFWTGFMQNGFGAQSLKVHVLSTVATNGTVTIPLTGWSASFSITANGVAVIDVPTSAENNGSESVQGKGVLIQSVDSVNVFISSFQNYTHDLSQVLPEPALGTVYRVDSYQGLPNFNNLHKSELLVLATQDGTQVRITPSVNTSGGHGAGIPFLVDLDEGESYQVQASLDHLDLTGTLVEATDQSGPCRPFAVIGGSMCATAPGSCSACDHVFEQLIPVSYWGTRYFTVPVNGVTSSTYRILAHQNGTTVSIGGGTPIALSAGQKYEVSGTNTPVCIQANLPVSVVQMLEGYICATNGDPSLIILSPEDRVSKRASFSTLSSDQLNQHSVSVVMATSAISQLTLDGTSVNSALFQPYGGCSDRSYAKIPVTAGLHRLHSSAGFQAYMFGLGYGESYGASVNDIGAVPVQEDSIICGAGTITLNAPEPLTNPTWTAASDPSTVIASGNSFTLSPTQSESYTVNGLLPVSGCPRSFTYHVGIPLTIPTLLTANDQSTIQICQYEPVQLALVPPPDPNWFVIQWEPSYSLNNDTISAPVATPMSSTWYTVEVVSPTGCGNMLDSILLQVEPGNILALSTSVQPGVVCAGTNAQLSSEVLRVIARDAFNTAPNSQWTAIQGGAPSNVCGSHEGSALYFNGNGQRYAQTIAHNTIGGGSIKFYLKVASGTAPCDDVDAGEDVVLEYSTNNGLNWSTINTYLESAYSEFTAIDQPLPPAAISANTMLRIRQIANSGAGQDNWALDEFILSRFDNSYASYAWSQPSTLNNPASPAPLATPVTSGWYVLSATDPVGGCVYTDSVQVQVDPSFSLNVTDDLTLCSVAGTQLQATPSSGTGISYSWTPVNGTLSSTTTADPIATPTETTTYTVIATTASGCTASEQVTISVGQLFGLSLGTTDDTLCQGQSAQLNASINGGSGVAYSWTGAGLSASDIANPTATPLATTTYVCTATHTATGCQLVDSVTITVNTGYTLDAGPDQMVCSALGIQLSAQHNVPNPSFNWTPSGNLNSAVIASPTILSDVTATYTIVVTDQQGCSVSDQVTITRAFAGVPSTQSVSACANTPPTLTAPASGTDYLWSTGATSASITPLVSGPHTVTITDGQGCQTISTFNVTLHALPIVNLGNDLSFCGAPNHVLDANNTGSTFLWSTSEITQSITVATSGSYTVTVTNANNCSASDAVDVQFNAMPVDVLSDVTACIATPPTLDAGNTGSTYLWNTSETTQSIVPASNGPYSVTITTAQQCTATFAAVVTLAPLVSVELGNDTVICQGSTVTLNAEAPGSTNLWSTSATTPSITVGNSGTYSVVVSNGQCSATDAIIITVIAGPADALNDVTRCIGETVTLNAGNPGCTYLWNTNATTPTISLMTAGTYSVVVTNANGCSAAFDAQVQFVVPPTVDLGADTVLCEGQILQLNAGDPGSTYAWSTGSAAIGIPVSQPGTYSVTVNNGFCQRSDAINVLFNPSPARMAVQEFHTCLDDEPKYVVIDAGNAGSQFDWSTGESTQVIMASAYGWYYVHVTNAYDCSGQDSARVIEYCPATIFIPNTFTPNGDGLNDYFLAVGKSIATMHLMVFDRWGELLFESEDPEVGWDGTYRGEIVKNDMYVWRVSYKFYTDKEGTVGFEQNQSGGVQVLR